MKKILASLLVLALCAPAMAATISIVEGTGADAGKAIVTIDSTGDTVNMVGLGLDVDTTADVTAVEIVTPDFNIYPDAAYSEELGDGYVYGEGTPVAAKLVAGEIALATSPQSFALSFGNLNGIDVAGATGADTVVVKLTLAATGDVTVCENATRGGIVAVDGTALDAACAGPVTINVGPGECFSSAAGQKYTDWVAWGKPDCWCFKKQCNGDINGSSFIGKPVTTADLNTFKATFNQIDSVVQGVAGGICADLNHAAFIGKRVTTADLNTFKTYFNVAEASVPLCPLTTAGGDIVFYTN